jgi:nitroreductase
MELIDCMFQRRSIRRYKEKHVDRETLELLIKAAMAAPTACNNQPWEFIAIREKETMDNLRKKLVMGRYNAPAAIVVCGNMKLAMGGLKHHWDQDCSAALENILLAATALGLGSIWIGVYPIPSFIESVREALNIPEYVVPLGIAYVGYADEEKEPRTQYNEKRVYWEKYDCTRKHRSRPKNVKNSL